jgi:hypothetical protein
LSSLLSAYLWGPVLFSQEPLRVISNLECDHIAASHVFRSPPDELPVLDEMLSTGRFDVLQDEEIKEHLRNYALFRGLVGVGPN